MSNKFTKIYNKIYPINDLKSKSIPQLLSLIKKERY